MGRRNAKMNEFQAAMGLCNLHHLDQEIDRRRLVVERYPSGLAGAGYQAAFLREGLTPTMPTSLCCLRTLKLTDQVYDWSGRAQNIPGENILSPD